MEAAQMARRPTRSQRQQIAALIAAQEPLIRQAFEAMAAQAKTALDVAALIEAIQHFNATRDPSRVIDLLRINQPQLFPLEEAIRGAIIAGGQSVTLPTGIRGAFSFNGRHPRGEQIIAEAGARLVSEIGSPGPEAIRAVLLAGQEQGIGVQRVARQLAGTINRATGIREGGIMGLDAPRAQRAARVREILSDPNQIAQYFNGDQPRYTSTDRRYDAMVRRAIREGRALTPAEVDQIGRLHETRLLKARGQTIAANEAFTAQAMGRREAYAQMLERGDVVSVTKRWQHASLKNPRPDHRRLHGIEADFNEAFPAMDDGARLQYPHDPAGGATHSVACRCSVIYIPQFRKD